jgi:hypothetical protein
MVLTKYRITLFHHHGAVIADLVAQIEPLTEAPALPSKPNASGGEARSDNGPRMTENQKRFIFRLLAGQKIEGKDAERHLLDYFKVRAVSEIGKAQASTYIEQLVADQKDADK